MAERQHFEIILIPKSHGVVIDNMEKKLLKEDDLLQEINAILEKEKITPTKVFMLKEGSGKGSKKQGDLFEGFEWRKYHGKIRGEKKGFFIDMPWKCDFYIHILRGKKKDGVLFQTDENTIKDIKKIGQRLHERILLSMRKYGPIPHNQIIRTSGSQGRAE